MSEEKKGDSGPTIVLIVAAMLVVAFGGLFAVRLFTVARVRSAPMSATPMPSPVPFRKRSATVVRRQDGSYRVRVVLSCPAPQEWTSVEVGTRGIEGHREVGARVVTPMPAAPLPATFSAEIETDPVPPEIRHPDLSLDITSRFSGPDRSETSGSGEDVSLDGATVEAPAEAPPTPTAAPERETGGGK